MIEIKPADSKAAAAGPTRRTRWGIAFLVGSALAITPCLVAAFVGFDSKPLLALAIYVGGWLLVFSAVAFLRADPDNGILDGLYGASVGASTMGLLVAGWTPIGQTAASVVSGAFLGAVVGVVVGWSIRSARARRTDPAVAPGSPDFRDPWIDP